MFVAFVFARHVRPGSTFLYIPSFDYIQVERSSAARSEAFWAALSLQGLGRAECAVSGRIWNLNESKVVYWRQVMPGPDLRWIRAPRSSFLHICREKWSAPYDPRAPGTAPSRCHGAVTVLSRCCHVFSACSNMLSIEAQYAHSLPSFAILAPCCSGWRSRCVCLNPGILESSSAELLSNYLSYCQPLNSKQRPPTVENPPWCQFQNIIDDIDVCIKLQLITILLWEFDKYCWSQSFCWDPRRLINRKLIYRKGRPSI